MLPHMALHEAPRTIGSDPIVLQVRGLTTVFNTPEGAVRAVTNVSFDLKRGEVIGLVGESGSGKTVTGLSLLRLLPKNATMRGQVIFDGKDVTAMSHKELRQLRGGGISMVFQDPMTSLDPVFTIGSQMVEVMQAHSRIRGSAARGHAIELLRKVGVSDPEPRLGQYPHQLSGGIRQRTLIAMALANRPQLLIADEPTTALDVTIQAQILALIREINAESDMSVIFITHDLGVVAGLCDRIFVMYGGHLVESGAAADVFERPEHPYTAALVRSALHPKRDRTQRLIAIPGSPPSLLNPGPGCMFAARCPLKMEICVQQAPPLTARSADRVAACYATEEEHAPLV
jgi:oligopeptide/dipeptide ABC transporter ATP-binding protein